MKKAFLFSLGMATTALSFAQVSVGIQGIGSLATAKYEVGDFVNPTKKMRSMPGGGLVLEKQIKPNFAIRSGVNYLQQGAKLKIEIPLTDGFYSGGKAEAKTTISYLQIPVNLLFTAPIKGMQFYAGGGPYLAYGLSGKSEIEGVYFESNNAGGRDEPFKEEVDLFKRTPQGDQPFKRTDFGVNVLAGVKLNSGLFAGLGYNLGLSNIGRTKEDTYQNRALQFTLGFFF